MTNTIQRKKMFEHVIKRCPSSKRTIVFNNVRYFIAIPNTVYVFTYSRLKNKKFKVESFKVFFSSGKSKNQIATPAFFFGNVSQYGEVCFGKSIKRIHKTKSDMISNYLSIFWQSKFSSAFTNTILHENFICEVSALTKYNFSKAVKKVLSFPVWAANTHHPARQLINYHTFSGEEESL